MLISKGLGRFSSIVDRTSPEDVVVTRIMVLQLWFGKGGGYKSETEHIPAEYGSALFSTTPSQKVRRSEGGQQVLKEIER